MKNFLVHFYDIAGVGPTTVETPLVGSPRQESAAIANELRKRHPKLPPSAFRKLGSTIESRGPDDVGPVVIFPGATLRQVFEIEGREIQSRRVGRVWFSGAPYDVQLIFIRAKGVIGLQLQPRIKSHGVVKFSNQISPQESAENIETLVKGVLGADARNLELNTRASVRSDSAASK